MTNINNIYQNYSEYFEESIKSTKSYNYFDFRLDNEAPIKPIAIGSIKQDKVVAIVTVSILSLKAVAIAYPINAPVGYPTIGPPIAIAGHAPSSI